MPAPTNERQSLERERDELPAQLAGYQKELDATPQEQRERRGAAHVADSAAAEADGGG